MDIQLEENGIWVEKSNKDGTYENEKPEYVCDNCKNMNKNCSC